MTRLNTVPTTDLRECILAVAMAVDHKTARNYNVWVLVNDQTGKHSQ